METINDIIYDLNGNPKTKALAKRIELAKINDEQRWRKDIADTRRLTAERMMEGIELTEKTRCSNCIAVGNAAKTREALIKILGIADHLQWRYAAMPELITKEILELKQIAESALSAPPRNCDKIHDVHKMSIAESPLDMSLVVAPREELLRFIYWLFAEAKGETK